MRLPVKEIAPIAVPRTIDVLSPIGTAPPRDMRRYSATDTRAAVAPPIPLNRATICGIAVIWTVRAK